MAASPPGAAAPMETVTESSFSGACESSPSAPRRFSPCSFALGRSSPRTAIWYPAIEARAKAEAETAASRRLQVGSGDRSQRIRTYNFPQGRITDHRVEGLTLYRLPEIVAGDLDELVDRLTREHQVDELKMLTEAA